ncbi:MAG: sulfotransferase [Pyrinomonadaceae bacterium]|nr:sulfotransferase [Pyrinomonadaceae bacterium]
MDEQVLPTFFLIGAPKCGTSSLHHYLGLHPDISMSVVKEPQVFAGPDYDAGRVTLYERLLSRESRARGESSAVYSQFPRWANVPERIHAAVPEARFVYLVGDPVTRVVAHYSQRVLNGGERRSLSEATEDWNEPNSLYLCASRYATQVRRYLRLFPESRLFVVDQWDLLNRREDTLEKVFSFLGVDARFRSEAFAARLNTGERHRVPSRVGRSLEGSGVLEAARSVPLPGVARRPLRRLVSRRLDRPALDDTRRRQIEDALRPETEWLRGFAGRRFESWSV